MNDPFDPMSRLRDQIAKREPGGEQTVPGDPTKMFMGPDGYTFKPDPSRIPGVIDELLVMPWNLTIMAGDPAWDTLWLIVVPAHPSNFPQKPGNVRSFSYPPHGTIEPSQLINPAGLFTDEEIRRLKEASEESERLRKLEAKFAHQTVSEAINSKAEDLIKNPSTVTEAALQRLAGDAKAKQNEARRSRRIIADATKVFEAREITPGCLLILGRLIPPLEARLVEAQKARAAEVEKFGLPAAPTAFELAVCGALLRAKFLQRNCESFPDQRCTSPRELLAGLVEL